ncbi:MAG: sulfatase [Pirellulales bacterium]|nr:sulfatase [Pirellulales bacterium]
MLAYLGGWTQNELSSLFIVSEIRKGMMVKHILLRSLFFVVLASSLSAAENRPNIVFIFTDDHAPHAIGAYDGWLKEVNPTPNIDQLAAQGMLFTNSFCTNSICGPSRAVIQTGKHSHKNGFRNNGDKFNWAQQTFPKLLQSAGYETAIYGKSHLAGRPQGYDKWVVLPGQGLYYNPDFLTPEGKVTIEGYCTDIVTDMGVEYLKEGRDKDKPFLLMVQHKAPHRCWMPAPRHLNLYDDITIPEPATLFDDYKDNAPPARFQELEIDRHMDPHYDLFLDLVPTEKPEAIQQRQDRSAWVNLQRFTPEQLKVWRDAWEPKDQAFHEANLSGEDLVRWKFQRYAKNYLRCVKGVDESVGRIMETLKEEGLAENTVVVYCSDQGFYVGDHGWYDKRWMYDESMKMPFVIKWPDVIKPGSVDEHLIQNIDYAATFLEMAATEVPEDIQGESLVPLLKGEAEADWRTSLYYHYYEFPSVHMVPRHYGIRTERFKLMHFYEFGEEWEFYDLEKDPDELKNLYGKPRYAKLIEQHKMELKDLQQEYEDDSDISEKPLDWQLKQRKGWVKK